MTCPSCDGFYMVRTIFGTSVVCTTCCGLPEESEEEALADRFEQDAIDAANSHKDPES